MEYWHRELFPRPLLSSAPSARGDPAVCVLRPNLQSERTLSMTSLMTPQWFWDSVPMRELRPTPVESGGGEQ